MNCDLRRKKGVIETGMDYLSLCLICKDENDYLPEWLDYHILMGVERFYIYDNESRVSLRESLADYIQRGWVVVMDIQGRGMQLPAYDHCLQTFGSQTRWMGFIDTDEFLVAKTSLDLKDLLRDYETYGGLAVSMLYFGSNGHKYRPEDGQIAAYTRRIDTVYKDYALVKSIVQPERVLLPNSPHDFIYQPAYWCVNESLLRVDNQDFPAHIQKIQLNHYFCRSEAEIDLKLSRGNSGMVTWQRRRFEMVNRLAVTEDRSILQILEARFQTIQNVAGEAEEGSQPMGLLEKMAVLVKKYQALTAVSAPSGQVVCRAEITKLLEAAAEFKVITAAGDRLAYKNWLVNQLRLFPQKISLYTDLAFCMMDLGETAAAWQVLAQAWQLAPNSYFCLFGMTVYFLRIKNFEMAEKTCHLLLELAPHDLTVLGLMTESLLGLGRFEEALKIGVPVVELSALVGELPPRMGVNLVKQMADHLLGKQDYTGAQHLWRLALELQPGDAQITRELNQIERLQGNPK